MLRINQDISIPNDEIEFQAIRAQGSGGQNVNKVSSAIHLRFDINQSSLPDDIKQRLKQMPDERITQDGVIVIKAQRHRSQQKNKKDALSRLRRIILPALEIPKVRKPSKPSKAAKEKRLADKAKRSQLKKNRTKQIRDFD